MMWGWGAGWWLVGAGFMVICMLMMGRMMGGMGHGHLRNADPSSRDDPERTLADRLARGEIDIEEYHRLLEALRHTDHPARA